MKIRIPRPRLRTYLATAAMTVALLVASSTPAQAFLINTWSWSDGFEVNPASVWVFSGSTSCPGCGWVNTNPLSAHSGNNSADIETFAPHSFFSALTFVHIAPPVGRIVSCSATAYVAPPNGQVNVEIINPADWTYISLKTNSVVATTSYEAVTVPAFRPPTDDLAVRISVLLNGIQTLSFAAVDDVSVRCAWF